MPTVTQSRSVGTHTMRGDYVSGHGSAARKVWPTASHILHRGNQTTTSWRTGVAAGNQVEGEELISGVRNRADFYKRVRDHGIGTHDNGHEFSTVRQDYIRPGTQVRNMFCYDGGTGYHVYSGDIYPSQGVGLDLHPILSNYSPSLADIHADGRELINRSIPTAPEAGMTQLLAELKERLPSLVGYQSYRKGVNHQNLGGEYLNVEFGIKPLISDVQKLAQSVLKMGKLVENYRKNSDTVIRRKRSLGTKRKQIDIGTIPGTAMMALPPGMSGGDYFFSGGGQGSMKVYDVVETSAWFAGAYTYHLAESHSFLGKMMMYEQLANKLLGSRFTAETAYELTPWSWLLDWQSDVGTFVSNMNALSSDSLVLRYGYVMHRTEATRFRQLNVAGPLRSPFGGYPTGVLTSMATSVSKTRTRASPYGFGIKAEALSPRQWAILGALGMSKTPGKYH